MAVRSVHDLRSTQVQSGRLPYLIDLRGGPYENRLDQTQIARLNRSGQCRLFARMRDSGWNRFETLTAFQNEFVFACAGFLNHWLSLMSLSVRWSDGRPVLFPLRRAPVRRQVPRHKAAIERLPDKLPAATETAGWTRIGRSVQT